MKKKVLIFPYLWGFSILSVVSLSFIPTSKNTNLNSNQNNNTNQRISLQDETKLVNQANNEATPTLGKLRRWQNNNFTGIELADKGFAVLTGDSTLGYSASRTNSFGGVLWTYNPETYNANPNLKSSNGSDSLRETYEASGIKGKAVVEIQQDSQNPTTYYALLVPKRVLDSTTSFSSISYTDLQSSSALQASVVQIQENLNNASNPFQVTAFANINPHTMVANYPSSWKVENGPTFFSKADHPGWFSPTDPTNMMSMWGNAYIANIGNMYVANGYVLIFGGNGSQYNDPDALSIGVFRLNFNDPKNVEVVGIPYAYILAGLATNFYPGRYLSRLPVGQDATFSYVPRMAVGGVSAYPGLDSGQSPIIFLAGSLTVGQDAASWSWASKISVTVNDKKVSARATTIGLTSSFTAPSGSPATGTQYKGMGSYGDPNYVTSASGSGVNQSYDVRWKTINPSTSAAQKTNYIPRSALQSYPTEKNSIDPLTLAGFKLNLASILNLEGNNISNINANDSDRSYLYIVDPTYFDFGINIGFVLGFYIGAVGTAGVRNEAFAGVSWASGGPGQYGRPQQAWDGGLGMFTSLFGYSPKAVGNLVPYNSKHKGADGKENNLGFAMQVGAFIYFFNLTGYDGYTQLPTSDFNPVLTTPSSITPPTNPANITLTNSNGNRSAMYYTYAYMPSGAYYYDALIGNNASYFDPATNQLKGADAAKLAKVKPWSDFAGLSVINSGQAAVASTWISNGSSQVYINSGFSGPGLTDESNKSINATVSSIGHRAQIETYPRNGSFLINGVSIQGTTMNNLSEDFNSDKSLSNLSGVINTPNEINYYFQYDGLGINYYVYTPINLKLGVSFQNAAIDRRKYLGSGAFIKNPGDIITTKSISDLYDNIDGLNVLKPGLFSNMFNYQEPTTTTSVDQAPLKTRIIINDINVVTQTATFTAQVKNPFTNEYETIPSNDLSQVNQNANVTYNDFFGKQPSYLLAVAISVPLIIVALAVGLGLGIGIPINKNKKALKQGFDISNKKVDTLTTAVGSVFKQIINKTQIGNIKKSPQMLKAKSKPSSPVKPVSAPKKIVMPTNKPTAPINKSNLSATATKPINSELRKG